MLITVIGKALPSSRHWLPVRQFGQTKQSLMLLSVFVLRERNTKPKKKKNKHNKRGIGRVLASTTSNGFENGKDIALPSEESYGCDSGRL